MLEIKEIDVVAFGKTILKRFSLTVRPGEIHAIMGPNGAGKSTLAKVLAGHPDYEVIGGEILLDGQSILELEPEERATAGMFMGFQYPVEIPGISNETFLHTAHTAQRKARGETPFTAEEFKQFLKEKMAFLGIPSEFQNRFVNDGFSGGEKKKNEMLQLAILDPKISVLDEIDSGLDIDAMKVVAEGIHRLHSPKRGVILITHYERLLNYIQPDFVHVVMKGEVVLSSGKELAKELEEKGYDWIEASHASR